MSIIKKKIKFFISYILWVYFAVKIKINYRETLYYPLNHTVIYFYLRAIIKIFEKYQINYFVFFGALLGCIRQNSVSGSGKDLDIVLFNINNRQQKNLEKDLLKFKLFKKKISKFQIQYILVNKFTCLDLYILHKKNNRHTILAKGLKPFIFRSNKIILIKKKLYGLNVWVPKNYIIILKELYGLKWRIPNKKKQFYCK